MKASTWPLNFGPRRWHGIVWLEHKAVRIQLHTPRWQFRDRDWFLMAPTLVRAHREVWKGDDKTPLWGFGLVLLGFGFAITFDPRD